MEKKKKRFDRYTALLGITLLIWGGIISQLVYLQVIRNSEFNEKANKNAITQLQDPAPRGDIKDKNGIVLATSQQSFTLTFTETSESKLYFYQTMDKIFKILDDNQEIQKQRFELNINPFSFAFNTDDDNVRKWMELRFKKDRGMDDDIKKAFEKSGDKTAASDSSKIDAELLKKTPEDTFKYLVNLYDITAEGIFRNYAELYKTNPEAALDIIEKNYEITSEAEVKTLLEQYKNDKKNAKTAFTSLLEKCNVSKKKLSVEEQRRYMLVKDDLKMQQYSSKPATIASNIKNETAFLICQQLSDLPGIEVTLQPVRKYPYNQLGSAFLGYISKISVDQDKEKYDLKGYDVNTDYIGISGIEGAFEDRLKGSKGAKIVRLNPQGRIVETLGSMEPYPGNTVQLTIDSNVQYATEVALDKLMKDLQSRGRQNDVDTSNATRAAAVAIDVNTGGIIALASRPGFDPNDFANPSGLSNELLKKYFQPDLQAFGQSKGYDQAKIDKIFPIINKVKGTRKDQYDILPRPLYNYATLSLTPPGSTFKPMTAIAGLESGVITPSDTVVDNAFFDDGHNFKTTFPSDPPNGVVDLVSALAKSSNPYFMTVGQRLRDNFGDDKLAEYAYKFGLGADPKIKNPSTGLEITENFGQVFNSVTLKNRFADSYLFQTMDVLKSGKGFKFNFMPIELHINGDETPDVKELKQKIRLQIQNSIKNGTQADSVYKDLLTKLITTDPLYKGKVISEDELNRIIYEIQHVAIYDGNYNTKIGANIYNASIGQGISTFTPVQLADYVATIVNGGKRYKLHLVDKILDANGEVLQETKPEVIENTGIKQETIEAVKAGMHAVVGEDGTAAGVFTGLPVDTAGKTGSATYRKDQDDLGRTSYGVYVGFAPFDHPKIAVAVLVFDGGHGGFVAPVARAIYEAYFKQELDAKNYAPLNDVTLKPITEK